MITREPPYTREILRLAAAIPYQVDLLEVAEAAEYRSRTCGSVVRVVVELDSSGRVSSLHQAVEACAYGQAAAALMGARAFGADKTMAAADLAMVQRWLEGGTGDNWLTVLEPALHRPNRHEAILLPFRALVAAIDEAGR